MLEKQMGKLSPSPALPVSSDFPSIHIHSCFDIYAFYRFDPMQFLFLGVGRMVTEVVAHMLCDELRTTPEFTTTNII